MKSYLLSLRIITSFQIIFIVIFNSLEHVKNLTKKIVGRRLYATVDLDKARVGRTRMIGNQHSHPKWNETFEIYCAHNISEIIFTVKDGNPIGATLIGRAFIHSQELLKGRAVSRWLEILDEEDRRPVHGARIRVTIQYFYITEYSTGITPSFNGVPRTFFDQRQGCKVTLYQDAHVLHGGLPWIAVSGGKYYEHARCWEDIYDSMMNAKHLIYITGWSVYTEITLVRDKTTRPNNVVTLGEILKAKAEEGVRVLMLVWDDRSSVPEFKKDGLMGTHDQETEQYFRNTKVKCVLCPRNPDDGRSIVQGFQISTMFTHHQKSVVLDGNVEGSSKRGIISFVGGIDLCDGRYDTQEHPLFSTLNTVHRDDFHQPNFPGASIKKGGPREPWHDVHCKLEGPVAWDVLYNFEQRWEKQVGRNNVNNQNLLFTLDELDQILVHPNEAARIEDDRDSWNVQLFRSIDGGAVYGFPQNPEEAAELGLVSGKDNVIDRSIQDAYIHAIRRAKNFIYIENQYFLGSSYGWKSSDIKVPDINALNLIPKELSLKICKSIEAGLRFAVYVVIPMWPEVDDEYIIIGSANINQRSMDGGRDTEIAMGAYQPHHIATRVPKPRGHVHAFRRALWYEHLGDPLALDEVFNRPESLECVKLVNHLGERNRELYTKDEFDENITLHHLLQYPIKVSSDGSITTLSGFECFPDTKAHVLGSKSDYLPPILTT
ncbi:hypothetical protein PIB30_030552 [Stylosanthes scabra]|uniref:Phospholipase D n=1 Tax=Stylosanthes scabra TaxID=79078 RepID=A0ABU6SC30_9FABA|nr:hypothetical protein [Stylosanthes scabra]